MISFNSEKLDSDENLPLLKTSFIRFKVATATFNNMLNNAVLEECLYKMEIEKIC